METSQITGQRKQEKLKLMQELGLENAADTYAEKHSLVTMRFRPIDRDKIRELLRIEYHVGLKMSAIPPLFLGGMLLSMIMTLFVDLAVSIITKTPTATHFHPFYVGAITMVTLFGLVQKFYTETTWVADQPLKEWNDDLPYGALLAVKEAKEQGYKDFRIYFPVKADSVRRFVGDPIITAVKNKKQYNIFAWDDGKIYE